LSSAIGRKIVMAVTGLLMIGFLITHMAANLLVVADPHAYNAYSEKLISNPLIYLAEAALLGFFVFHFAVGIVYWRRNRAARPHPYALKTRAGHTSRKSLASSTMIFSGLVMLVFVPLHIVTFKFGPWYDVAAEPGVRDLHRLVVEIFQKPLYVVWYLVALPVLGAHAWHGFGSAFESVGVSYRPWLAGFGRALAVIITAGFLVVPVYVYFLAGGAS
jgi:succinate dehydrogenase / fumarate reductase cytochrome b subunit